MDNRKITVIQIGHRNSYLIALSVFELSKLDMLITDYYPSRMELGLANLVNRFWPSVRWPKKILVRNYSELPRENILSIFTLVSFSLFKLIPYHFYIRFFFYLVNIVARKNTILLVLSEAPVLFKNRTDQVKILESVLSAKRDLEVYSRSLFVNSKFLKIKEELFKIENESIGYADKLLVPSLFLSDLNRIYYNKESYVIPYYSKQIVNDSRTSFVDRDVRSYLFVGRISVVKGVDLIVEIFRGLSLSKFNCTLVGPLEDACLVEDLPSNVRYLGFKNGNELRSIYLSHDFFLFPTLNEGSALVVYEALGFGMPVITTEYAGSILETGKCGKLISPDRKSILDAINDFNHLTIAQYQTLSAGAIEIIKQHTVDVYKSRVKDFLKKGT